MPMAGVFYLYFLKLQKGFYYVGITKYPKNRLKDHFDGVGCKVTKKYRPIKILGVWKLGNMVYPDAEKIETNFTLEMMKEKGNKVRGGLYHHTKEDVPSILASNIIPSGVAQRYERVRIEIPGGKRTRKQEVQKDKKPKKDRLPQYRAMPFEKAVVCLYDFWQSTGQIHKSLDDAEKKILKKGWYMK